MAETTIEWTKGPNGEKGFTFNPWIGCTKVGPGCDNCYAEADFDKRKHVVKWGAGQPRKRTAASTWAMPIRWNAEAKRLGVRYRVFCASLADVFDNEVPVTWRRDLFDLIAATSHLDWLLVTKRIGNARRLFGEAYLDSARAWPGNIWIGATITNQAEADRDIPKLLEVPAAVRFLSMEPLLGPVDLTDICHNRGEHTEDHLSALFDPDDDVDDDGMPFLYVDWVIVGGESGPNARPMHPEWVTGLRRQCADAGVPFLFKQWGEWVPMLGYVEGVPVTGPKFTHPDGTIMGRAGKKAAGRQINGLTYDEYPSPTCGD